MFEHHRKSPWFAEKYDPTPEYENLRTRVRKEGWKGRLNTFLDDLESGKFDSDMYDNDADPTSAKESTGTEGASDANGDTAPMSSEEVKPVIGGDDDMQFNADVDEEGDHDAPRTETNGKSSVDNRRNTRGEEVSVPPEGNQVMIRTIPPDIGRVKLEEVGCFFLS